MEVFGLLAFLLAAAALAKIRRLEKQLKEAGVLKEWTNDGRSFEFVDLATNSDNSYG